MGNKYEWRDDVREGSAAARSVGWRIGVATVVVLLFVGLIAGGAWLFKVVTSDVKGAGDATVQNRSAANRLQAQAKYASLYEGIQAADRNIDTLAAAAADDPTQVNKTNLIGAQNVCQTSVADYNSMATNALTRDWIPPGLPSRVGDDRTTDCKPSEITPTPTP